MLFFDLAEKRYSLRNFSDRKIEDNDVKQILKAGWIAPSARNAQPWFFHVFKTPDKIKDLTENVFTGVFKATMFAAKCNCMNAISRDKKDTVTKLGNLVRNSDYRKIDIGITTAHMVLQAKELGIDSCIIGWFDQKKANKYFKLSKQFEISNSK